MLGMMIPWAKKWMKDQGYVDADTSTSHAPDHHPSRSLLSSIADPTRSRRDSGSLNNNAGSPEGSRASSIAGDNMRPTMDFYGRGDLAFSLPSNLGCLTIDSDTSSSARWDTHALQRPVYEPPVLDYRKFEEGGRMYDSINRHPQTRKEDWYEYTDAEIESELLGDYQDWIRDARVEAVGAENRERVAFYEGLSRELDVDREEPHDRLLEIKQKMYVQMRERSQAKRERGKRVQEQFDMVRKVWRDVDSGDSGWDEAEWEIFGERGEELRRREEELQLTEENLKRRGERAPSLGSSAPLVALFGRRRSTDDIAPDEDLALVEGATSRPEQVPINPSTGLDVTEKRGGIMACFSCCFG